VVFRVIVVEFSQEGDAMIIRITICTVVFLGAVGLAFADQNALLKGTYSVTNSSTCNDSGPGIDGEGNFWPGGFADGTLEPLGFGATIIDHLSGSIVFDGKGRATEQLRVLSIFPGPVFPGVGAPGVSELTCDWDYSVNTQKTFILNGRCTGSVPSFPGGALIIDVFPVVATGQISESGAVFIASSVDPVRQTLVLTQNGNEFRRAERICADTRMGIRMHDQTAGD